METRRVLYLSPACRIRDIRTERSFLQSLPPNPGDGGGGGEMEEGGEI